MRDNRREAGYFWVKYDNVWTVAEYCLMRSGKGIWFIPGLELDLRDKAFSDIDERPILREK